MTLPREESLFVSLLSQELGAGVYVTSTPAPDDPQDKNKVIVTSEDDDDIHDEFAWCWIISITCASEYRSQAQDLAFTVRDLMLQFMEDGAEIAGLGQVGFVKPTLKPTRNGSSPLDDNELHQYTAAYRVTLHLF